MINPDLIRQCVHCGFCLQACPTYVLWGNEMDSPRGRIYLMNMLTEGQMEMTPKFVQHMDTCLGCVSCMTACPSGVNYGKLIEETRAEIEHTYKRPLQERVMRWGILHTFPNVGLLRIGRLFLSAYQKLGLPSLANCAARARPWRIKSTPPAVLTCRMWTLPPVNSASTMSR